MKYSTYLYSRGYNPTVKILSEKLAALDGAEDCLVFNSGAAAILHSVLANVKSGDHIVSVNKPYTWAQKMFNDILPRFGVTTTYIDGREIENFENAILPNTTLFIWNLPIVGTFALQDLKQLQTCQSKKISLLFAITVIATPLIKSPLNMGLIWFCKPPQNILAAIAM